MDIYNKGRKQCEPFSSETSNGVQPLDFSLKPWNKEPINIRDIHKLDVKNNIPHLGITQIPNELDRALVQYFTQLLQNETKAISVVQNLTHSLTEEELASFSKHLQTLTFKTGSQKYNEVTTEVVSQLEEFIVLIKTKNLDSVEQLQENSMELYQELREAFVKAKILKNRLRFYFKALYGVELSAKIIVSALCF